MCLLIDTLFEVAEPIRLIKLTGHLPYEQTKIPTLLCQQAFCLLELAIKPVYVTGPIRQIKPHKKAASISQRANENMTKCCLT